MTPIHEAASLSWVDRDELTELTCRLAWCLDTKRLDELDEMLTACFTMTVGDRAIEGRAAAKAFFASAVADYAATAHHLANQRFALDPSDDTRATGDSQVHAWHRPRPDQSADGDLQVWARYHDVFTRTAVGWRMTDRLIEVLGTCRAHPRPEPSSSPKGPGSE